jgi:2-dehydro-3-deoxyphosphogluconate aldolase/(4S)-4-hydroxy-2-oxoglutarate aldolase
VEEQDGRQKFKHCDFGILRGIEPDLVLISAIDYAGLETIEITMNTKGAAELIRKAVTLSKERLTVGAGTVLDMRSLKLALDAGATFIVTPVLILEVTEYCTKNRIPVFPGALTPQEIYTAWRAGATIVKVFPSNFFGPEYFKEIKWPFNDVELMACGGVTPQNLRTYFACGASAVSFGASVFKKEWLSQGLSSITNYKNIFRIYYRWPPNLTLEHERYR